MRRMLQHCIGALALAVALLASPAEAANSNWMEAKPGLIEQAWHWLAAWLTPGAETPAGREEWTNVHANDGGAIDPNGRNTITKCRDDGGCIDPNG